MNTPDSTPTPGPLPSAPKKNALASLVDKETRLGRFNRAALRWAALVLSLYALGLFTSFFLLYRPTFQYLIQTQSNYTEVNQNLSIAQRKIQDLTATNTSLANQVLALNQNVDRASQHIQLLKLINSLQAAHISIDNLDTVTARQTLISSRTALDALGPVIDKTSAGSSKIMLARLDLITSELDQTPKSAAADLDVLIGQLLAYEKANY